jgi:hypothetical protein
LVGALAVGGETCFQAVAAGAKFNVEERLRREAGRETAAGNREQKKSKA